MNDAPTMRDGRSPQFQRNGALEVLLTELNAALRVADAVLAKSDGRPEMPVVLVVGGPRSGSTVTMQFLASTGSFAYPTNLLSRFYAAPAVGARIQAMAFDPELNFRDELADLGAPITFESDLGKTTGARQPSEFWYFWRRFFPLEEPRKLSAEEIRRTDRSGFLAGLASMEEVLRKPLALKAALLLLDLPLLVEILDRVVLVDIRRHPFFQSQSLLLARRRYFGNDEQWYSVKPPEWRWLRELDPYHQVAGQVLYLRRHVDSALAIAGPERSVVMDYDVFCRAPNHLYAELGSRLSDLGYDLDSRHAGPSQLENRDSVRVGPEERDALLDAWHDLGGEDLSPLG